MRTGIALSLILAVTGCQTTKPTAAPIPTVIEVVVTKFVKVPAELTADCQNTKPTENTYAEAKRLAMVRLEYLDECTQRMRKIRSLK